MSKNKLKFEKNEKIEDKVRIEEIAVGYITTVINEGSSKLKSDIPVNDKGVSFDGSIILTKGKYTTKDYIGRVPVQVKGKQLYNTTGFPKQFKFPLKREHFENYYSEGGVLLIVVGIVYNPKTQIYQKKMYIDNILRLKAKKLLEGVPSSQASISTVVSEIEDSELETVCFDFFDNFDRQPRMVEVENISLPTKGMLTETYISKKKGLLNKEFYVSEGKEGVFSKYITPNKFRVGYNSLLVTVGENEYELSASYNGSKKKVNNQCIEEYKLVIEEQIELTLGGNYKFNISEMKFISVQHQLKILPFLKDLLEKKKLNIPGLHDIEINGLVIDENEIQQLENNIELMTDISHVFEEHNIELDTSIQGNYEQILETFSNLKEVFINKNYQCLNGLDDSFSHMIKVNVHNVSFLTFYNKENNTLEYPFNDKLANQSILISKKDDQGSTLREEPFPSIYITLTDFPNICNLNYAAILKSFDNIEQIGEIGHNAINLFLLERIREFDESNDREILRFSIELCQLCLGKVLCSTNDYTIYTINYFQCIRRIRKLRAKEAFELANLELSSDFASKELAEFCKYVLVDDMENAQQLVDNIDDIIDYPIYNLYSLLAEEQMK
ncbi:MAG: hypothetical protein PWR19_935 [Carnobacterium sp.]|uniref:hypothetical protein n=1 Tax=Carnobacterium sp. TaxID=48221 RepID=UPI002647588D|nr:hypothetical protein [Carnobacterium sp.]MDN5371889.1 hypothetical protein [Carnobacterium sp.]